jgi:MFS family permease
LFAYLLSVQASVYVAAPFFTPYMLNQLELDYLSFTALLGASLLARILALPALGQLARRFGVRALLTVGGLGIVPLAGLWLVSNRLGYLLFVQAAAGIAWGAHELAVLKLFFETIDPRDRTRLLTAYNLASVLAMVAGSLVGGVILHRLGESGGAYVLLFALSSLLRVFTLGLLVRVPVPPGTPAPLVTRTLAVRPSAGAIERPILSTLSRLGRSRRLRPEEPEGR